MYFCSTFEAEHCSWFPCWYFHVETIGKWIWILQSTTVYIGIQGIVLWTGSIDWYIAMTIRLQSVNHSWTIGVKSTLSPPQVWMVHWWLVTIRRLWGSVSRLSVNHQWTAHRHQHISWNTRNHQCMIRGQQKFSPLAEDCLWTYLVFQTSSLNNPDSVEATLYMGISYTS